MGSQLYQKNLLEKLKESLGAVLPIIGIVLVLCFSIAPIPNSVLMTFVVGAVLLIIGMMFFTLGAEMAMTPMGERIGTKLTNTRKISVVIVLCFILGFIITISEPDLQVLAEQVPSIPNYTLIIAVATGVGIFLVAAVLRMLFGIPLAHMLLILYPIIFILASIVPQDFLTVAFDSGGVTTGPMTVPFIMALGIGFSAVRSDKHAENDSFGLVALCSVGHCSILTARMPWPSFTVTGSSRNIRSEEHTSERQSRPHISYAVFCLKKKKKKQFPIVVASVHPTIVKRKQDRQ